MIGQWWASLFLHCFSGKPSLKATRRSWDYQKEFQMSDSKRPNPANVGLLFCVRILQPLLDPIQGWSRFYSASWAELLCNPHLNDLIWKAGGFYPGTSGSAAFKEREQESGLRWMWSHKTCCKIRHTLTRRESDSFFQSLERFYYYYGHVSLL